MICPKKASRKNILLAFKYFILVQNLSNYIAIKDILTYH